MPVLGELASWGYDWAWSPPRSAESVDIGAIFRLAPGLMRSPSMAGTVEFAGRGPGGRRDRRLHVHDLRRRGDDLRAPRGARRGPGQGRQGRLDQGVLARRRPHRRSRSPAASELASFLLDCLGAAGPGRATDASRARRLASEPTRGVGAGCGRAPRDAAPDAGVRPRPRPPRATEAGRLLVRVVGLQDVRELLALVGPGQRRRDPASQRTRSARRPPAGAARRRCCSPTPAGRRR